MTLAEHRRKVLRKLGFVHDGGKKHEKWVFPKETKRVKTGVSHGNGDVGHGLLKSFCKQLHITKQQYQAIASCNMSQESYYKHLVNSEIV